jgi:purine-binding chemotaxis protein CheW
MREYLAFSLAGNRYAFAVSDVDSVVETSTFSKLPGTAPYMRGLMNLRGVMVPVVDLRVKFGLPVPEGRTVECVIVLSGNSGEPAALIGAIADEVHEVVSLDESLIEPAPSIGSMDGADDDIVAGIGRRDHEFIVILDALGATHTERCTDGESPALGD